MALRKKVTKILRYSRTPRDLMTSRVWNHNSRLLCSLTNGGLRQQQIGIEQGKHSPTICLLTLFSHTPRYFPCFSMVPIFPSLCFGILNSLPVIIYARKTTLGISTLSPPLGRCSSWGTAFFTHSFVSWVLGTCQKVEG